ncbi:MAG: DNA/RNA non-specific endonuclease [Lachnospiraceae bacterium]|nr:DNA/RNA non-specific endonuclease [Lachnospiraceae bacterium]
MITNNKIDYKAVLSEIKVDSYEETSNYLYEILPDYWCWIYKKQVGTTGEILQFKQNGFEYLFDLTSTNQSVRHDDRVIAAFGFSKLPENKRDTHRIHGFLQGVMTGKNAGDKGHFIAHASGGGLDVNLFPQRQDINRGLSQRGKVWRSMERYCSKHPGTFFFTRPTYTDHSWRPSELEMGILLSPNDLWVESFEN